MRAAAFLAALLLASWPAAAAPFLVGSWFGTGQPRDRSEMFLAHMLANGDFRAQFRTCIKGKMHDSFQTGSWNLTDDSLIITIVAVDGLFNPRNDAYKILSHDDSTQTYRYVPTGFVYKSGRVRANFQMPDCGLVS